MITEKLYEKILINPVLNGCDTLLVASGYASANMVAKHLNEIHEKNKKLRLKLIIGMCARDGISRLNHNSFKQLSSDIYPTIFECNYFLKPPPFHSKLYIWLKNNVPVYSFIGSANYTQNAFSNRQIEIMSTCDLIKSLNYYKALIPNVVDCRSSEAETNITILDEVYYDVIKKAIEQETPMLESEEDLMKKHLNHVRVSFLDNKGNLPQISGLNWGQRDKREKNQAYIRLPSTVYKTNFFPPRGDKYFTIITDDGFQLICTRAQENGKAIETPHNNSIIGLYFRKRIGLDSGVKVNKQNLVNYGRTDVDFYKIDDETFHMDFSVK